MSHPSIPLPGNPPGLSNSFDINRIGSKIQKIAEGEPTEKGKWHAREVSRITTENEKTLAAHQSKLTRLSYASDRAEAKLNNISNSKYKEISLIALSVIAIIAAIAIALVTHTWPIVFVAVPFALVIVHQSRLIYNYKKELFKTINAFQNLSPPKLLELPTYDPSTDLGLKSTREKVRKEIESESLEQLSKRNVDEIIDYALLNRIAGPKGENRNVCYNMCIALIKLYRISVTSADNCKRALDEHAKINGTSQDKCILPLEEGVKSNLKDWESQGISIKETYTRMKFFFSHSQ